MAYEEYFRHLPNKTPGHEATEQEIDEKIALVSQLMHGRRSANAPFGEQDGMSFDVRALDRGEKFPGQPCPHCTRLAVYKWIKSMHETKRNGTPLLPML